MTLSDDTDIVADAVRFCDGLVEVWALPPLEVYEYVTTDMLRHVLEEAGWEASASDATDVRATLMVHGEHGPVLIPWRERVFTLEHGELIEDIVQRAASALSTSPFEVYWRMAASPHGNLPAAGVVLAADFETEVLSEQHRITVTVPASVNGPNTRVDINSYDHKWGFVSDALPGLWHELSPDMFDEIADTHNAWRDGAYLFSEVSRDATAKKFKEAVWQFASVYTAMSAAMLAVSKHAREASQTDRDAKPKSPSQW